MTLYKGPESTHTSLGREVPLRIGLCYEIEFRSEHPARQLIENYEIRITFVGQGKCGVFP